MTTDPFKLTILTSTKMISANKLIFKRTDSMPAVCNCNKLMDPDIYSPLLSTAQQIVNI